MINYKNTDKKNKSFMYQNLQKSKCFNVNFSNSNFNYVCFRGAHMKACNFIGSTFKETEFVGANLKESLFKNAVFENAIFEGTKLEGVDFRGATFINTYFVSSNVESALNLNLQDPNIKVYSEMPVLDISDALKSELEKIMQNAYVKRSRVLDTKDKQMNTISVMILLEHFGETVLIENLGKLEAHFDRDFYTLSFIIKLLNKVIQDHA